MVPPYLTEPSPGPSAGDPAGTHGVARRADRRGQDGGRETGDSSAGAILVKVEGHPGLDDKMLFGGVYPDGKGGFSYVEGPLSEAWRYAAEDKRAVLLLDELARMDALYHALLIGALDTLSGAEIAARPKLARASTLLPFALAGCRRMAPLCGEAGPLCSFAIRVSCTGAPPPLSAARLMPSIFSCAALTPNPPHKVAREARLDREGTIHCSRPQGMGDCLPAA